MTHLKWSWAMKNYATHLERRIAELKLTIDRQLAKIKGQNKALDELEKRIEALESLRRADRKVQDRMRERLDKYEDSDWDQKQRIIELEAEVERLRSENATLKNKARANCS